MKCIPIITTWTLLIVIFSSCTKEQIKPDSNTPPSPCLFNCDTSKLNLIWQHPLQNDTMDYGVPDVLYENGKVFYGVNFTNTPNNPVYARDANNGNLLWEWTDYHPRKPDNQLDELHLIEEYLIVNSWHEIQVIDVNTGLNKWTTTARKDDNLGGYPRMTTYGNEIFHIHNSSKGERGNFLTENHIVKANIDFPKWDTLISFFKEDSLNVFTEPPTLWINPEGDSILITTANYNDFGATEFVGHSDLVAYNLSKKELYFKIVDYIAKLPSAAENIALSGNTVILTGSHDVVCIDLLTKEVIWEKTVQAPENFGPSPSIFENKVIVNTNDRTYAYDLTSGRKLWQNDDLFMSDTETTYKGNLYGTSCTGRITCINMQTGETLLYEKSPNANKLPGAGYCFEGMTIDKENGFLYASDGYFIQCIKLPF